MAIIILSMLTFLMNILAHLSLPPHSIFIKKLNNIEKTLAKVEETGKAINTTLIIVQQSNEEMLTLLKNKL